MDDRRRFFRSIRIPLFFVAVLWLIKGVEMLTHHDLVSLGNFPRKLFGLTGIISSPLVHGDISHLTSNSVPILIMGSLMLYFYPSAAKKVILGIYVLTGIAVWLLARPVYHIGASGLVYGFAFFLFFSGVFRSDMKSLAISFFIIFMYGSIVWGLAPGFRGISWESHLFGAISGSLLAYHYRFTDMPPKELPADEQSEPPEINYRYIYVPKNPEQLPEGESNNRESELKDESQSE